MAKYLLDSHTIIWYLSGNENLSTNCLELIEDTSNEITVSIVSYWEMGIKISIDKLTLPIPLKDFIKLAKDKKIQTDSIPEEAVVLLQNLPFHHKDPFDRLLVAQALQERIPILSKDSQFDAYGVNRIW